MNYWCCDFKDNILNNSSENQTMQAKSLLVAYMEYAQCKRKHYL